MTMLKYFYDNDLVRIYDKTPTNWREAINVASENLKEKNIITDEYVREVIKMLRQMAPTLLSHPVL